MGRKRYSLIFCLLLLSFLTTGCREGAAYAAFDGLGAATDVIYESMMSDVKDPVAEAERGENNVKIPTKEVLKEAVDSALTTYYGDPNATLENKTVETVGKTTETATDYISQITGHLAGLSGFDSDSARQSEKVSYDAGPLPEGSTMEVHFIDVGQGDCTLIACDGEYMLIDAGTDDMGTYIQNYLYKQHVSKLTYLILTHNDADHIGSADVIITKFDIGRVFLTSLNSGTRTYRDMVSAMSSKGYEGCRAQVGDVYRLGGATFTIVAPNREYTDTNNSSIAIVLQHGRKRFLLTGDAGEEAERNIANNGIDISSDVYKAGHHGSKTSSSESFLDEVKPTYCIISCGEKNEYFHPHATTLARLRSRGIKVFRTDEQGTIIVHSNGEKLSWNCPPSETYRPGEGPDS